MTTTRRIGPGDIRAMRWEMGLSQAGVARLTGTYKQRIGEWELGKATPRRYFIVTLCWLYESWKETGKLLMPEPFEWDPSRKAARASRRARGS